MKVTRRIFGRRSLQALCLAAVCSAAVSLAQEPASRLAGEIDDSSRVAISGSLHPLAKSQSPVGRLDPALKLQGMSIVFSRSAAQQADLKALMTAQQTPGSPFYHQWLTPEQFAARFGLSSADIQKVQSWLEQQGFSVEGVARSKNSMSFSGTVVQVETAFSTQLNYYTVDGKKVFAPGTALTIPTALSRVVLNVGNLTSVRPRAHMVKKAPAVLEPNFTSGQSGANYLTPGDIATIYDVSAAYSAGYTGMGQSIAVVGQSSVVLSDIESFQGAAGLPTKDPTMVLVPNSGADTLFTGDEAESDLDLEWSGAIAKDATIYFVYTGNNQNLGAFDALVTAIDTRIAPVLSNSYGLCELSLSTSQQASYELSLQQAATQGQTVITASGDSGSTDCNVGSNPTNLTTVQQQTLAVDYPASSAYVTGIGGTEFLGDVSSPGTYWPAQGSSDAVSSALKYIPEKAWNDDSSASGLASGGGGASTLFAKPAWQTGVAGIPTDGQRDVPDISLDASADHDGYLYCSSDTTDTNISGSCSNGFRDSSNVSLTIAGGTSFGAPIFSGMLAILNQKLNSTGQGVINPTLYTLASSSATYASAFHDTTTGGNQCSAGPTFCVGASITDFATTTGYDLATGLGSIDFENLLTAWPVNATTGSALVGTVTSLSAASTAPASAVSDIITVTVAPRTASGLAATPTGTLTILVDGGSAATAVPLTAGTATYTFTSAAAGAHVIVAEYSGDATYAPSTGTVAVSVGSSTIAPTGSFTLAATNLTVKAGASGTSTVNITEKNGYAGTVGFTVTTNSATLTNACYDIGSGVVSGTAAVPVTLTIFTTASSCSGSAIKGPQGSKRKFVNTRAATAEGKSAPSATLPPFAWTPMRAGFGVAGLLIAGLFGYRSRRLRIFAGVILLAAAGFTASGCGGGSSSSGGGGGGGTTSNNNAPTGTYTLTIVGTDSATSAISTSTNMTLTIN